MCLHRPVSASRHAAFCIYTRQTTHGTAIIHLIPHTASTHQASNKETEQVRQYSRQSRESTYSSVSRLHTSAFQGQNFGRVSESRNNTHHVTSVDVVRIVASGMPLSQLACGSVCSCACRPGSRLRAEGRGVEAHESAKETASRSLSAVARHLDFSTDPCRRS